MAEVLRQALPPELVQELVLAPGQEPELDTVWERSLAQGKVEDSGLGLGLAQALALEPCTAEDLGLGLGLVQAQVWRQARVHLRGHQQGLGQVLAPGRELVYSPALGLGLDMVEGLSTEQVLGEELGQGQDFGRGRAEGRGLELARELVRSPVGKLARCKAWKLVQDKELAQ
jgi:hypothetical protein